MSTLFAQNRRDIKKLSLDRCPYLESLQYLAVPPAELYCLGDIPTERRPSVAIVGSRKPSSYGREVTAKIAHDLARRGVVIISGLALGVDAIAHQAALDAGGTTIALQANGLHALNPRTNRQLGEHIIEQGGAILSEYEPGIEAMKHQFLERNRLVSGLADAIIITEAAARSGSLNTAAHALEQGKEIYVVPGNITSPMSAGCNQLLRQGATPITSLDDIYAQVFPDQANTPAQQTLPLGSTSAETALITALASGIRDGDELLAQTKLTASEVNTALSMLEINGVIKPLGANRWTLL